MGTTITEWVDTGEKRDERGRRMVPAKERALLIEAYGKSGLTQRAFAKREGIKYFTFIDWLQQARQRGAMRCGGFIGREQQTIYPRFRS